MKGLLINPLTQEITEIDTDGSLESMYELIGCTTVETVEMDNEDTIWLDGNGWIDYKEEGGVCYPSAQRQHFFEMAGKILVLGTNLSTGESTDARTTLESAKLMFKFIPANRLSDLIHFFS